MRRGAAQRIDAVLFDWGDTLFYSPRGDRVLLEAAREQGVALGEDAARELWEALWAAGKTPHELAKGRDLSAEAHQRVWTSLFTRAEVVVPGAAATLYERVMDPAKWRPYEDTRPTLVALRERRVPTAVVSNVPRDLRPIFERHGLRELVDAFVLSYEHGDEARSCTVQSGLRGGRCRAGTRAHGRRRPHHRRRRRGSRAADPRASCRPSRRRWRSWARGGGPPGRPFAPSSRHEG